MCIFSWRFFDIDFKRVESCFRCLLKKFSLLSLAYSDQYESREKLINVYLSFSISYTFV